MHLKTFAIARAALTALLFGASAQATILNEYNTQAAWAGVTTIGATQNFNAAGSTYVGTSAGITLASVNYRGFYNENTSLGYDTYRFNPAAASPEDLGSQGIIIGGSNFGPPPSGVSVYDTGIRADVSAFSGIRSIGFNFSAWRYPAAGGITYSTAGTPIVLTLQVYESNVLADTRSLTVPAGSPLAGFYGFTSSGDISGVRLLINSPANTDSNRVALDNFAYGAIAAGAVEGGGGGIPEPQTYLLCAAGLLGVSLLGRRNR